MNEGYTIGVDLGGTKLNVSAINLSGELIERILSPTKVEEGPFAIEQQIIAGVQEISQKLKTPPFAIGIGLAGQIEAKSGTVLFAPNLKWRLVPIKEDLEAKLKIPVFITNDVKAATWGEWIHGEGIGCEDLVCLFVGTGIGCGIVSKGCILEGASNSAGEFGHMVVAINGRKCHCGNSGCLEAYAGGWAIAERAKELVQQFPEKGQQFLKAAEAALAPITTKHVAKGYQAKDPLAIELISEVEKALIAGAVTIVNGLNPKKLILGGGVIEGFPHLVEKVEAGVKTNALQSAVQDLEVVKALHTTHAGVIGAAVFARKLFLSQ